SGSRAPDRGVPGWPDISARQRRCARGDASEPSAPPSSRQVRETAGGGSKGDGSDEVLASFIESMPLGLLRDGSARVDDAAARRLGDDRFLDRRLGGVMSEPERSKLPIPDPSFEGSLGRT